MHNEEKIEAKLGFGKLRSAVAGQCATGYGRDRALEEHVSTDSGEIGLRLGLSDEMRVIMMFEASFPDAAFQDCLPFIVPLKNPASSIDRISLARLRSSLDTLRKIVNFFGSCKDDRYPLLRSMSAGVVSFPEVLRRIDVILDKYGEIRDNASETLSSIRRSIRDMEGTVSRKIQAILRKAQEEGIADEDATVSVRDGKMLIPVASGNKKKLSGIVYDESSSGRTSFVEPIEVVELNNRLTALHFEEQREILRILMEFSDFLRPYLDELIEAHKYMGELDFIIARTSVAGRFEGGRPVISDSGELLLKKARHPLLEEALKREGKSVVPLDVALTPQKRILLISGPNAGGKSVCLKTVGLLQYMFQWGMLVPASESSEMTVFDEIFVDIGDDQSIENDLSTYSSHLLNMKETLEYCGNRSLVLIDEFGSGTEPAAGGAIAEEILSEFEKKGCYGIITTHYTNLKFYANNSASISNGAMLFDVQKIQPLFKLEIGLPGNSFAFELARKIGLPESVVKGAEERAGKDYVTIERNLRKIARNKREIEERLTRVKAADRTLDSITGKYEKELADIKLLRKNILDEAKREAMEIVSEANRKIENTIREIRESQAEKQKTQEVRADLKEFASAIGKEESKSATDEMIERKMARIIERKRRQQERREKRNDMSGAGENGSRQTAPSLAKEPDKLSEGSYVSFKDSGLMGEVVKISGDKATVAVGDILTRTVLSNLVPVSGNRMKAASKPHHASVSLSASISERKLNFKPSIDIRGMRLEEAVRTVTRFIDDAMMVGMDEVSILHGKGNGILKEEIRKYLKITPGVASFADEHVERGGSGITVVKLD